MIASRLRGLWAPSKTPSVSWDRVLVLGSANYVRDWWATHEKAFDGWTVLAINNAWAVPGADRVDVWARSDHFWRLGKMQPPLRLHKKAVRIRAPEHARIDFRTRTGGGGTMFVSVLWRVLEEAKKRGHRTCVAVAGSDFDYRGAAQATHFYGGGKMTQRTKQMISDKAPTWATGKAADPLRFGLPWLRERLGEVEQAFTEGGHEVWNVGGHDPSELPFPRRSPGDA